jgi:hypothetical protein
VELLILVQLLQMKKHFVGDQMSNFYLKILKLILKKQSKGQLGDETIIGN